MCDCHICGGCLREIFSKDLLSQITSDCRPWNTSGCLAYCINCGVVQKYVSKIWLEEVNEIYSNYQVYKQGGGAEQTSFNVKTGTAAARSQQIVAWLKTNNHIPETGKLLDIGCGNGAFLRAFGSAYPRWQMTGFELDTRHKVDVESISRVTHLHVGSLENLDKKFDLIVMVHALEHIPNPARFLCSLRGKLSVEHGRLLIQVPNLITSPFDLLIADHCSHFSAEALVRIVSTSGYRVQKIDSACIPKELTLITSIVEATRCTSKSLSLTGNRDARVAEGHLKWVHRLLQQAYQLSAPIGVFGSSISGTWLASTLGDKAIFFVDEAPDRTGRTHLDRPIYSPTETPAKVEIAMPMHYEVARVIAARLSPHGLRFITPPKPEIIIN